MKGIKKAPSQNDIGAENQTNYTPIISQVQELIQKAGSQNPATRSELARLTGVPDRQVRFAIEDLRNSGERIITSEKGGYYYAENEMQYRRWRVSISSRISKLSKMLKAMDERTEGQIEL